MDQLIIFLVLMTVGYSAGTIAEKRHYKSIIERERKLLGRPLVTIEKAVDPEKDVVNAHLVAGSVVVSVDYFKRFLAGLRNIFGGTVKSYESLLDRAKREAVLRMRRAAGGADVIVNMRIETSSIGKSANRRNSIGSIEVLAYGTAVRYRK